MSNLEQRLRDCLHGFAELHDDPTAKALVAEFDLQGQTCEFCGDPATKTEFFDRTVYVCDDCSAEA